MVKLGQVTFGGKRLANFAPSTPDGFAVGSQRLHCVSDPLCKVGLEHTEAKGNLDIIGEAAGLQLRGHLKYEHKSEIRTRESDFTCSESHLMQKRFISRFQ
jgi:hypothetical protein